MQRIKFKINSGFTLLELLLYVSLSAIIIFSVSIFTTSLLQARVKNQVIAEVEQGGMQAMQLITQTIRNTTVINSPGTGTSATALSVATATPEDNPTIFELSSGSIMIKEGVSSPVALTNSILVIASDLDFQNLTKPSTTGIIRVSFTLTHKNISGRNEYNYSKTFHASASLK